MNNQYPLNVYYWTGQPNFGDLLTPTFLNHYLTNPYHWSVPQSASLTMIGSVLDVLPPDYSGIVAGSGKLHSKTKPDLRQATVLGLRGKLTARDCVTKDKNYVLGDPGLLVSEMVTVEREKYDIGVIPHWSDTTLFQREYNNAKRYRYGEVTLIDPTGDPLEIIRMIGSCKRIVASSLHAIIAADAFSIPRRAERFEKMSSQHEGGEFKFHDYASALEQPIEFGTLQWAPKDRIQTMQYELFDMITELKRICDVLE